jgi:hypothetical protein
VLFEGGLQVSGNDPAGEGRRAKVEVRSLKDEVRRAKDEVRRAKDEGRKALLEVRALQTLREAPARGREPLAVRLPSLFEAAMEVPL